MTAQGTRWRQKSIQKKRAKRPKTSLLIDPDFFLLSDPWTFLVVCVDPIGGNMSSLGLYYEEFLCYKTTMPRIDASRCQEEASGQERAPRNSGCITFVVILSDKRLHASVTLPITCAE